jgi:uncharacterized membrane protein YhfC
LEVVRLPSALLLACMGVAAALKVLLPIALLAAARSRLGVGWRYAGYGALVFVVAQLLVRAPLTLVLDSALEPALSASPALVWAWLLFGAVSAGLVEEVGRYLGFRWLMRVEEKTWPKAVMVGLGHGGVEAAVYSAGVSLLGFISLASLTPAAFEAMPESQRQQLMMLISGPPWLPLLGVWERLCAMTLHVAWSVLVIQVFRRGEMRWLGFAVGSHTLVDALTSAVPHGLGAGNDVRLLALAALTAMAAIAGRVTWRLRDGPTRPSV